MPTADAATPVPNRAASMTVHRVEVWVRDGLPDPAGAAAAARLGEVGVPARGARVAKVYLLEGSLTPEQVSDAKDRLLVDPVTEAGVLNAAPARAGDTTVEVHPLPGVMDPAAQSVREALRHLLGVEVEVSTGRRYDLSGVAKDRAEDAARRALANTVVHRVHLGPFHPERLPRGQAYRFALRHIPVRGLGDDALLRLSREAHLFLSLDEMRAVRDEFERLGREPTDIEVETIAQTWSEHCVHKTLKSRVRYREAPPAPGGAPGPSWAGRPGHVVHPDGTVEIDNLLKRSVAAATHELIADGVDWCLSVFQDNSGVVAHDDRHAVCIKVETHNHPSALEPYGGSATGIGGCIRDVIGTGLGARPIASTDVFCVAPPDHTPLPAGCLEPRRVLREVVAGVRDYGNRMGIPTVNGAVWFDPRHVGNPLVFCGCVGLLPSHLVRGAARAGDLIVALGGRTGRDGIHGATFSSAELTDQHADEFAHAVQIGNAIEEKRLLDAVLRARDAGPLFTAITDCGAGGFSSAVGEMGASLGAEVQLDRAPLKYAGLSYAEIWISEAQERMVLSVPEANLPALLRICDEEGVELAVLGRFGTPGAELVLRYHEHEVGRLSMAFLHDALPQVTRRAEWNPGPAPKAEPGGTFVNARRAGRDDPSLRSTLLALLAHPNVASKHWIIRQYDHEVRGATVVKPLIGPLGRGPSDASVLEPVPGSGRGVAIGCGLATSIGDPALGGDPYHMALAGIDECVRNLVCVGADPDRTAILDNFCWPGCQDEASMGALVRACAGCYDAAKAYRTPFVSGKDSLNNQLSTTDPATGKPVTIRIPPTLLITGLGHVHDLSRCVTADAKRPGRELVVIAGSLPTPMRGSLYARLFGLPDERDDRGTPVDTLPTVDLAGGPAAARVVAGLIRDGLVHAAHDVSDGGLLVAVAEMLIAGSTPESPIGADIGAVQGSAPDWAEFFSEAPSRYVLEMDPLDDEAMDLLAERCGEHVGWYTLGTLDDSGVLCVSWGGGSDPARERIPVEDLARAWLGTLDW